MYFALITLTIVSGKEIVGGITHTRTISAEDLYRTEGKSLPEKILSLIHKEAQEKWLKRNGPRGYHYVGQKELDYASFLINFFHYYEV